MIGAVRDIDLFGRPRTDALLDAHIRVFNWRNVWRADRVMSALVALLAIVGFLGLYSASRNTLTEYYQKQVVFFFVGTLIALVIVCADHRFLVSLAPAMYVCAVAALVAVLLLGREIKGAQRWLIIGPFRGQPSEPAKLVVVYMLAWYFTRIQGRIRRLPYFALALVLAAVPGALILMQPNLGTAASLGPLVFVMLYVAGCRRRHLLAIVLLGLSVVPVVWWQLRDFDPNVAPEGPAPFYQLKDHQKIRILAFLDPEADVGGEGLQTYQSKITIGSGGLTGKGFLRGTQTYLRYLPEHHTDFIFSSIAEEGGFVGSACVLTLFLLLFWRGLSFARTCPDLSGALLAVGTVTILAFHVCVNIGITVGLLPVTGLPLPFLSYGGSFYVTTMMCVGVLLNVPMRSRLFD